MISGVAPPSSFVIAPAVAVRLKVPPAAVTTLFTTMSLSSVTVTVLPPTTFRLVTLVATVTPLVLSCWIVRLLPVILPGVPATWVLIAPAAAHRNRAARCRKC